MKRMGLAISLSNIRADCYGVDRNEYEEGTQAEVIEKKAGGLKMEDDRRE